MNKESKPKAKLETPIEIIPTPRCRPYPVSKFNEGLNFARPTVDIVIHYVENPLLSLSNLKAQIDFAKATFHKAGVQLKIVTVAQTHLSEKQRVFTGVMPTGRPETFQPNLSVYRSIEQNKNTTPPATIKILSSFIKKTRTNSKIVHVVAGVKALYSFYDNETGNKPKYRTIETGGLSFAPYWLEGRIPRHLRGVITISSGNDISTLAHELGHKLINVSHEGKNISPQFSGVRIPGLMGYEGESQIYKGAKGRWHWERLHLSPFIYKIKHGKKTWNPEYKKNGRYDDPIYKNYLVDS